MHPSSWWTSPLLIYLSFINEHFYCISTTQWYWSLLRTHSIVSVRCVRLLFWTNVTLRLFRRVLVWAILTRFIRGSTGLFIVFYPSLPGSFWHFLSDFAQIFLTCFIRHCLGLFDMFYPSLPGSFWRVFVRLIRPFDVRRHHLRSFDVLCWSTNSILLMWSVDGRGNQHGPFGVFLWYAIIALYYHCFYITEELIIN